MIITFDELLSQRKSWNDLWFRGSATNPTALAEPLALWVKQFAPNAPFRAVVVQDGDRFVAALPLVGGRKAKVISAGTNPSNAWSLSGQLLVDETQPENVPIYLDAMVAGLWHLPFSILWLDHIRAESSEWTAFRDALKRARIPSQWFPRYSTAVEPLNGPYETLRTTWSKKSVSKLEKTFEKQYVAAGYAFGMLEDTDAVLAALPECFGLENRSWKGGGGGTMLQSGTADFYTETARLLAERGMMKLAVLRLKDELIAFKYCFQGKNTLFSQKTSYDPKYRDISPGQVLQLLLTRRFCDDPTVNHFDFVGEAGPHQMIWNSETKTNAQVVVPISVTGRAFFFLYDAAMPFVRRWKYGPLKKGAGDEGSTRPQSPDKS